MHHTTLGTCLGCGFGASVPYTHDLKPGTPVVVMTEDELNNILRASAPPRETAFPNSGFQNFRGPMATWLLGVRPSSHTNSDLRTPKHES